jgi:circadian clock protein KaiC
MRHSNQIREFVMSADGIALLDVYTGPEGVLTGSMRAAQEAREAAAAVARAQEAERKSRALEGRRAALEAQMAALRAEHDGIVSEAHLVHSQEEARERAQIEERAATGRRRGA